MSSAVPTLYRGIQFRSRLEATWAAFISACGWQWEYEPAIFDGKGWLPDFLILPEILVEVKPVTDPSEWAAHETVPYILKRTNGDRPVFLFGTTPLRWESPLGTALRVGSCLLEGRCEPVYICCDVLSEDGHKARVEELGFISESEILDMPQDVHAGAKFALWLGLEEGERRWAHAKNETQWRPD